MSPVLSRPRSPAAGKRSRLITGLVIGAVAVVVVLGVALAGLGSDRVVDNLRVDNPTRYDLTVEVAGGARDGWTGVGVARHGGVTDLLQVGDQGPTWVFRFSYAGVQAGEVEVRRATLERDGWRLQIPPTVADRLTAAGIGPPP